MKRSNPIGLSANRSGGIKLSQRYWWLLTEGACAIVFGILAIAWPRLTFFLFLTIFGIYALVDGLVHIGHGLTGRGRARARPVQAGQTASTSTWSRWLLFVEGGVGLIAGLLCIVLPRTPNRALLFIIAAWLIIKGIGFLLQAPTRGWLTGITGVLAIAASLYLFIDPTSAFRNILLVVGIYALIMGVTLMIRGWKASVAQRKPRTARAPAL
jgi:uncharacterized membrane protein HdeD (DUF308 family)